MGDPISLVIEKISENSDPELSTVSFSNSSNSRLAPSPPERRVSSNPEIILPV
jgi:hypothetical protein